MARNLKEDPAGYITELFENTKRWRQPHEDRWKDHYKLYRNYRDETTFPFKSNIFVPYIFSIVESVVPKMLGTIFNTRPIISVQARKGASENMARLLERLLEYQLDEEQLEFFTKILEFFKECTIYGTSFLKVIPRFNDDELVSFNYIDVEPIDLFNVFPDYRAKSVRRMKYIIQLSYMDYDELERLEDQGFYKNVKQVEDYVESNIEVDKYKRERLTDIGILDEYGYDANRKVIEVLEYWDRDKIYVIGARKIVLKEEDNPFGGLLPFIMARYIPVQHELYGIGIPEISKTLQEELNTVRNQRMDNVNLIINRMFIANKYADLDLDQLVSYPGNVILTNDVNAIQPIDTRDITKSAYMEEELIKRDIDNACFDIENVEILTQVGWKPFQNVTMDDFLATRTKDGCIEYHKPDKIIVFDEMEHELFRFNGCKIEGDFTQNHKFPVVGWSRGNYKFRKGKPGQKDREFIKLSEITKYSNYKIPLTAKWNCTPLKDKVLSNGKIIPILDWLSFLGIYLAEGSAQGTKGGLLPQNGGAHRITIAQTLYTKKAGLIRGLLKRMGLVFSEQGHQFIISSNKALWEELYPLGNSYTKYIPRDILEAPPEQLAILFDWMMLGDGTIDKTGRKRYYTASKSLANDVQELLIKLGFNGRVYKKDNIYGVDIYKTKYARFQTHGRSFLSKIKKTCKVGCFQIKNHTFMMRVNGKSFWTGNCGEYEYSRGAMPPRKETATGIVRLQQAASVRFDTVVKMLEFTVIRHIAKMFLWLDYHFLPKDEFRRIVGEEEYEMYGGDDFYNQDVVTMLKQYHFQPMGTSTTAIKEVRIQQIMQAYKLFNMDPMIDQHELRKMVMDVLDLKNANKLLKSPEQIAMEQQMAQAQQQASPPQGAPGEGGKAEEGGPQPPPTPAPPQPGTSPIHPVEQIAQLARIAGGGLIKGGGQALAEQQGAM